MNAAQTATQVTLFSADTLVALAAFALVVTLVPRSNNLPAGPNAGLRRAGGHLLGRLWGTYLMICLAGVVLGGLFLAAPDVQPVLRVAAGVYMLWLASRLWHENAPLAVQASQPRRFGEAVLRQLGDSGAWGIAAAVVVGFVPAGEHYPERLLTAALVFSLASLPGLVLRTVRSAGPQDAACARTRRSLQRGMAAALAVSALVFWT